MKKFLLSLLMCCCALFCLAGCSKEEKEIVYNFKDYTGVSIIGPDGSHSLTLVDASERYLIVRDDVLIVKFVYGKEVVEKIYDRNVYGYFIRREYKL